MLYNRFELLLKTANFRIETNTTFFSALPPLSFCFPSRVAARTGSSTAHGTAWYAWHRMVRMAPHGFADTHHPVVFEELLVLGHDVCLPEGHADRQAPGRRRVKDRALVHAVARGHGARDRVCAHDYTITCDRARLCRAPPSHVSMSARQHAARASH